MATSVVEPRPDNILGGMIWMQTVCHSDGFLDFSRKFDMEKYQQTTKKKYEKLIHTNVEFFFQ